VHFGSILMLAVGLAMDATAVAAARGLAAVRIRPRHVLLVSCLFGGFQGVMPLIGWVVGAHAGPFVQAWDHWIVFVCLGVIGGKMVHSALVEPEATAGAGANEATAEATDKLFGWRVMLVLAVATSIDALAVGVTLPLLNAPIVLSTLTIGITTALLSALGLLAGRHFGSALGARLDVAGGLLLIGLGTKILIEHLMAG
jgi:putative Mn2+ efflux pump MntP